MKVFKFGGASVKDAQGIKNVASIVEKYKDDKLVVIVSAMGKTTNALESILEAYYTQSGEAEMLLDALKKAHFAVAEELFPKGSEIFDQLNDTFVEIHWVLEDKPEESYDYLYDQIVSIGEFLSTRILAAYFKSIDLAACWLDARDVILTDNSYREANVHWPETEKRAREIVIPLLQKQIVVTQGFVGGTTENFTTTLGREGSDFTAAIFSCCLDAESMSVWKDVPGILSADPKLFRNVSKIDRISYREAIEMTYYGAKVIHPKTIKPLQNKGISLFVKSFENPDEEGTLISAEFDSYYPPIIVVADNQVLLQISTKDFSFVAEDHISLIFQTIARHGIKVNMMQNTAISFSVCVTYRREKLDNLVNALGRDFNLVMDTDLELITIRHYKSELIKALKKDKIVLFEERIRDTAQIVVKNVPEMERISK